MGCWPRWRHIDATPPCDYVSWSGSNVVAHVVTFWKPIAVWLQAVALVLVQLGAAHAFHAVSLGPESHSHFALAGTGSGHAQPHHRMSANNTSDGGTVVADAVSHGDGEIQDKNGCCHMSGGMCAQSAVVSAAFVLTVAENLSSFVGDFAENFNATSRYGIFHPPRLTA